MYGVNLKHPIKKGISKKKILICTPYYFPYKNFGGGCKTIVNQVSKTHDLYKYEVFTLDHGPREENYLADQKTIYFKNNLEVFIKILFLDISTFSKIQFNSFFSPFSFFILAALFFKKTGNKIIIFPRGELSYEIEELEFKKKFYIIAMKFFLIFKYVLFVATSESERKNIISFPFFNIRIRSFLREIKPTIKTMIVGDFLDDSEYSLDTKEYKLDKSRIKMVFISILRPKKNLSFALDILKELPKEYFLDIYGIVEDKTYLNKIKSKINRLELNDRVRLLGEVSSYKVVEVFSNYNAFLFPTKSENFGYVILESLQAGCIPIISNKTPWEPINNKCGLVLDIASSSKDWSQSIQDFFKYPESKFYSISDKCKTYATQIYFNEKSKYDLKKLYENEH